MAQMVINGGKRLSGSVTIGGAKKQYRGYYPGSHFVRYSRRT